MAINWTHRLINAYNAQPSNSVCKNLVMTITVSLAAAIVVSTAAVLLQPRHAAQLAAIRSASMATLIKSIPTLEQIVLSSGADSFQSELVDLDSGCYVAGVDVSNFDSRAAASDPAHSREMQVSADGLSPLLKRRANWAPVFVLHDRGALQLLVLPVYGPGYQSTLYAWLALAGDLNTVVALNVYEHGDTPGIGSRVEDPEWQSSWGDKQLTNEQGLIAISVVSQAAETVNQVDGISGATRTSQGVGNMVKFWVGAQGFGPFLDRLKQGEVC
jgi:Na+-transporting NADH:ubiquinone oxidoreductase subunit C